MYQARFMYNEMEGIRYLYLSRKRLCPILGRALTLVDILRECVKRPGHQSRMTYAARDEAVRRININMSKIIETADFEELYDLIKNEIQKEVSGFGTLASYDLARRMGYMISPQIRPRKFVYLSAGAKIGAKKFLGRPVKEREDIKNIIYRTITKGGSNFRVPNELSVLLNEEIEDIFCAYHPYFIKDGIDPNVTEVDLRNRTRSDGFFKIHNR